MGTTSRAKMAHPRLSVDSLPPPPEVIAKTAAATGVRKNSARKIVSARKVIDEGKTRKAKVLFGKLDNFDVGVIRRIIHNLY